MKQMDEFIQNTVDPELFNISDVENDNACFYRAIANYIYFAVPHENMTNIKRFCWGKTKSTDKLIKQREILLQTRYIGQIYTK